MTISRYRFSLEVRQYFEVKQNYINVEHLNAGLGIEHCTAIQQMYARGVAELKEGVETSKVVQNAKFQARLKYLQEKVSTASEDNQDMYQMKVEIEKEHLK